MTLSEIVDFINEVEEKYEVDKWEIDGVLVWPLIRINLKFSLENTSLGISRTVSLKDRGFFLLKGWCKNVFTKHIDSQKNASLEDTADVILLGDGVSFMKVKDKWYDKFCDPFIDFFAKQSKRYIKIEPSHNYFHPRYHPSKFIQTNIDLKNIFSKFSNRTSLLNENDVGFDDYIAFFKERISLAEPITWSDLKKKVVRIKQLSHYYNNILVKVKPKLAMVVSYYDENGMAFNLACNQAGIPTVDIQHGVQGDFHAAYGRWNKVPHFGYNLLPTYFWCWSVLEAESIEKWSANLNVHKPLVGGNLLFDIWNDDNIDYVDYYSRKVSNLKMNSKTTILLTLQPGLDNKAVLGEVLCVVRQTQSTYNWWVRLHPGMLEKVDEIEKLFAENGINSYKMTEITDLPLYAILKFVDFHITHSSTVVIEAANMNIPSIVFSDYGATLFEDQISNEIAVFAEHSNQMLYYVSEFEKNIFDRGYKSKSVHLNTALYELYNLL